MTLRSIADALWQLRPWMAWTLAALYAVPLLRLAGFPLECGGRFAMRINKLFGRWEHLAWPLRDTVVALWLIGGVVWQTWLGIEHGIWRHFLFAGAAIVLLLAGWGMRGFRRSAHVRLLEFVGRFPAIHPQEFFDHLLCSAGAIRHRLPDAPFAEIDPGCLDFRRGAPSASLVNALSLAVGAWSTLWLARLVLLARHAGGPEFLRSAASALAVVWGARICQLAQAALTVEGREKLPHPGGAEIFLFTHMSFLDFALAPLALAARPYPGNLAAHNHLPSFLLAKDHFRDNVLLYRVLGIGRAAEAMGMIFVDRRRPGTPERAERVAKAAAAELLEGHGAMAIFPQGTRAVAFAGVRGERLDGAYYTVGSRERISADGKHLKRGAAHIAAEAAHQVAEAGVVREVPIRIAPIAIAGTAIACPRKSMRLFTNIHLRLRAGDPIVVDAAASASVEHLHARIDAALKGAGRVHAELERRFFEDMRGLVDPMQIEEIAIAMKPWRGEDYLVHAILDAIYACPAKRWRSFLGELVHALQNFATREELLAMKGRVAESVPL